MKLAEELPDDVERMERRMADTVTVTGLIVPDHFHQAAVAGSRPAVKLLSHHPPPSPPPPGHSVFLLQKGSQSRHFHKTAESG